MRVGVPSSGRAHDKPSSEPDTCRGGLGRFAPRRLMEKGGDPEAARDAYVDRFNRGVATGWADELGMESDSIAELTRRATGAPARNVPRAAAAGARRCVA